MLLEMKGSLIAVLYLLGALFVIIFPPRNFNISGTLSRVIRSIPESPPKVEYLNYNSFKRKTEEMLKDTSEVLRVVKLKPRTVENRTIFALELRSDQQSKKPGILVVGGIDGMSWGAPNAVLELAQNLVHDSNYQTPFFNDYDWYLIPMANPDALEFTRRESVKPPVDAQIWSENVTTRETHRPSEWHKNVQQESKQSPCFGVHINRNFPYHYQEGVRMPPDSCSQFYPGFKPFSTPESQALRSYIDELDDNISLAIHLHVSFTPKKDLMLYPWRYTKRTQSNHRTLQAIGEYAARQAKLPDGRIYEVRQSSVDGIAAGCLTDYVSGVVGTELVYLIKPYFPAFPPLNETKHLETYIGKATSAILSLVRGWRKSTKLNTLSFFGTDVEF